MEKDKAQPYDFTDYYGGSISKVTEDKIWKGVDMVLEALQESEEYEIYQRAKAALRTEPEKVRMINEFREAKYHMQNSDYSGPGDALESLFARQQILHEDLLCREYLVSEAALCNMIRKVTEQIMGIIDLEIPLGEKEGKSDEC